MTNTTEIVLKEGRFVRRNIQDCDLGTQESILAQLVEDRPMMIPGLLTFNDQRVHFLVSKGSLVICTQLEKLPFSTYWRLQNAMELIPTFRAPATGERGTVKIDDSWPWWSDLGIGLFCLHFNRNTTPATPQKAYLFAYKNRELFKIDYPNTYEDGSICMGREWDQRRTLNKDVMSDFIHAYTTFHTTQMNSDLIRSNTTRLFRRNLNGWIYPNPGTGGNFLNPTASSFMQGFVL